MIDRRRLEETLSALLRTPTGVPSGATEISPKDPSIVRAVRDVIRPMVERLAPTSVEEDGAGNLVATFGPHPEDGVLLFVYVVSQHANEMDEPTSGRVVDGEPYGLEGPVALGQGATQNKGAMAAVFAAGAALPSELHTGVTVAVNTEGRSSHDGSAAILDGLGARAAWGIVGIGTDLRVSLGNRGRLDVRLIVDGASAHSSQPGLGANPIPVAAEAIRRLERVALPEPHPELGPASVTPYQFRCHPVAPHTIPRRAEVVVDRRLLPGEDPDEALGSIRDALPSGQHVKIAAESGPMMWPALVDPAHPGVAGLVHSLEERGRGTPTFYSLNAFDAGYPCRAGIPTIMFGPGRRRFGGDDMMGADAVSLADCELAAEAILDAILIWDRRRD